MKDQHIYRDIARRCGGELYIGVVGPVRSGKSTFIRRFMEAAVLPSIRDTYDRSRTIDSLPQAGSGRSVMTTEPKFIPDEAVEITVGEGVRLQVRMIDCVGYLIPDALGQSEGEEPRMVNTPWDDEPVPFAQAAETGTRKVICDHATVGIVVTSDGSIGEIGRESYVAAEERVVRELSALGKPFAIVLNSAQPSDPRSVALALELEIRQYEDFLASAGYAFMPSSKFDLIIKYCVLNKIYNIISIDLILDSYGLPCFSPE